MKLSALCLLLTVLCLPSSVSAAPDWWVTRQALGTNAIPNDYAPVLRGQLCWMAESAGAELEEKLPGGASEAIRSGCSNLASGNYGEAVNLGQLKQVVSPFYQRLMEEGVVPDYPWSGTGIMADFSPVNIGQVKQAFDFQITGMAVNPSLNGVVGYAGLQTGQLRVVANPVAGSGLPAWVVRPGPGAYHIVVERQMTNWAVEAWRDTDGDSFRDTWEAYGCFPANPVWVTGVVAGVDFDLLDPDEDGDGIPGYVEHRLGLDPEWPDDGNGDEDGDGLSLGDEWRLGSNPLNRDSDGDGMGDGAEVVNGFSPTNMNPHAMLPFSESFETPAVVCGELAGQNGWLGEERERVRVLANPVAGSLQVLSLIAATNPPAVAVHPLATHGHDVIWIDCKAVPVRRMAGKPGVVSNGVASAFYFNRDGWLIAYDATLSSGLWICFSNAPPLGTGGVTRLTVRQDYGAQRWGLWLDGTNVVRSLPFATRVPELARLWFRGAFYQDTLLDEITVSSNTPAGFVVDSDDDGMPDDWERRYGLNPYDPSVPSDPTHPEDPDFDGLSSLQEYLLGLNPRNPDGDGDGRSDGVEIAWGTSPAHANPGVASAAPFIETFEVPDVLPGDLHGQHNWVASATNWAMVWTNERAGSRQALCLTATTNEAARLTQMIGGCQGAVMWTDFEAIPARRLRAAPPALHAATTAAFYIHAAGYPVVASGTNWLAVTNVPAATSNGWTRFTVKQDFSNQVWSLCLDGLPVTRALPFVHRQTSYSGLRFTGPVSTNAWLDNIRVTDEAPGDIDSDGDGLPEAWERLHGLDPANPMDPPDPDFDGLSNREEYLLGLDPRQADGDGDGLGDGTERARGLSPVQPTAYHGLPFSESFEAPAVVSGPLAGKNKWQALSGSEGAMVVSNPPYAGTQVLQLGGVTSPVSVYQPLVAAGAREIWTDLRSKPVFRTDSAHPVLAPATTAGFYVDQTGQVVVADATHWVTLSNAPVVTPNTWARFTTAQDFSNRRWSLYLDGWPVATGLNFASTAPREYSGILVRHTSSRMAYLDAMVVTSNRADLPARFAFADWVDLADSSDCDRDGLVNGDEYRRGVDPGNPDSDGDGMGDGTEVRLGFDPAVSNVFSRLPLVEPFEPPAITNGFLAGQQGWQGVGVSNVWVQTNCVAAGQQALSLVATGAFSKGAAATGLGVVWSDFQARPVRRYLDELPSIGSNSASAFFINATGQVNVRVGAVWVTLADHAPVSTSRWTRFTVKADYDARKWALWMDGVRVGKDLPFANPVNEFSGLKVSTPRLWPAWFDSLAIGTNEPPALDDDGDGLPNAWERLHGFDSGDPIDPTDPDSDGLSNREEYLAGTNPRNPDSDGDGLVDGHDGVRPLGLFPQGADRNGDGYADGEADYGCAPLVMDTDGDGVADGVEVGLGLNPALASLEQGLVGWYRLDETNGVVVVDSSTHRLDGQWLGSAVPTGTIGRVGQALLFDGLTSGVRIPATALHDLASNMTLSAWIRPGAGNCTGTQMIVTRAGSYGLQLTGRQPEIRLPGHVPEGVAGPLSLTAGEWTHLAAGIEGNRVTLYVNGEVAVVSNLAGAASGGIAPLAIGCDVTTTNGRFEGALDDVRIYGRVLNDAEIRELHLRGADLDGDTAGLEDELEQGSDPVQAVIAAGVSGDLDGDGRVTAADRSRLQTLIASLGKDITRHEYDEEGNLIRTTDALGFVKTVGYNGKNRPVVTTDANGNVSRQEVNALGAVTASRDPLGAVTRFDFNDFGNVVQITDPAGSRTCIEYNAVGQAVRTTNSRGTVTDTRYDDLGRVNEVIAAAGLPEEQHSWSFYDAADRLVSNRNQLGVANLYFYDSRGLRVKEISASGSAAEAVGEITYDGRGLEIQIKDPRGFVTQQSYDALGRAVTSTDALGHTTRSIYDNLGNTVSVVQPAGRCIRREFDKWGRVIGQLDGNDRMCTEYDALNRVTAKCDWRGVRSEYAYDAAGNGIETIEAKGTPAEARTQTDYDAASRPIHVTHANGGVITYGYDVCGNKAWMSNELGRVTQWSYQHGNRLDWTRKPDGVVVSNRYDALDRQIAEWVGSELSAVFQYDRLSRMTNAVDFNRPGTSVDDNRVAFAYDAQNRVVREWQNGRVLERQYDPAGNPNQLTSPSGVLVNRTYNGNNRLASLKNAAGSLTYAGYTYTPNGRVQSVSYASGVVETHDYDARERLATLRQQGGYCNYQAVLARDPNGNVVVSSETGGEGGAFVYDAANRVTARKALNDLFLESIGYDPLGNWLSHSNPVQGHVTRTVNAGNQYTRVGAESFYYDANGSLTARDAAGYVYDHRGRLVELRSNGVMVARYSYDALNRRVSKETGGDRVAYYYDGEALLDESVNGSWTRSYIYADTIDTPVVLLNQGLHYYYLRDWRANIAVITDATGRPVEQYRYSLFGQMQVLDANGNPLARSGLGNIWAYAGRQWDQESGLFHYRNRAYSPELGRFLQQDPAGYADGLNLYAYAGNNPLMFSDPYGLYRWNHGALDGRIGEWIVAQYGQLREIERQRRDYEEALRRAEEDRRRQRQEARARYGRALAWYQNEHPDEVRRMTQRYRHLGVNEREAAQLLMSGVTSIPRLGASVGSNDARRSWWLDYYLRGGEVNDVMRGEMSRMGTGDVDEFFAKTSQHETKLRAKRKARHQQYAMAAVSIVATVVTCGAGGAVGAAMLGTVGVSASATTFTAFAAGAVAIQGVASAATTMISHGNISDFAQSWAINSAASVAGYGAGYSVAKAGGEMAWQMATKSAVSTFVASGSRAALEGGGFKNVFRDTAISFVAGGMMGTFMTGSPDASGTPSTFGAYVQAELTSDFGYLHSPLSGGVQSSLRAVMYGGNVMEAFGEGAFSREALMNYAMATVIAPVASSASSALASSLSPVGPPGAGVPKWTAPEARTASVPARSEGSAEGSFASRAVRGGFATVASHVEQMIVAPARSIMAIYRTAVSDTWRERSGVINPFSRSFAGYKLVDGALDSVRVAGGLPVSFLSGDFLEGRGGASSREGLRALNFNGMANNELDAARMLDQVSAVKGAGSVEQITNLTHGWMVGDVFQALGNELGLIDITALRGANSLRGLAAVRQGAIDVTAHSQGTMTFRRALDLVDDPAIRSRIRYQGFGPQTFVSKTYLGLNSAESYWNRSIGDGKASGIDPIPGVNYLPTPSRFFEGQSARLGQNAPFIVKSPHNVINPNGNHHGMEYYAGYLQR